MEIHDAGSPIAATNNRTLSSVFEPLYTSNGARLSDSKPGEYVVSRYHPTGNPMAYLESDRAYLGSGSPVDKSFDKDIAVVIFKPINVTTARSKMALTSAPNTPFTPLLSGKG